MAIDPGRFSGASGPVKAILRLTAVAVGIAFPACDACSAREYKTTHAAEIEELRRADFRSHCDGSISGTPALDVESCIERARKMAIIWRTCKHKVGAPENPHDWDASVQVRLQACVTAAQQD